MKQNYKLDIFSGNSERKTWVTVLQKRSALLASAISEWLCPLFLANTSSNLLYSFCCIKSTTKIVVVVIKKHSIFLRFVPAYPRL